MSIELLSSPTLTTNPTPTREPNTNYGVDNPLELRNLPDHMFQTEEYRRGKKLYESGLAPIEDAAFIQVMGLKAGTDNEVASMSRDVVWDGKTPIEEFGETLALRIAGNAEGREVRLEWFGPYEFTLYIDDLNNHMTPRELVNRFVYAPRSVYAEYMANLLPDAIRDESIYEDNFISGENDKGSRFVNIYEKRISGQKKAFQKQDGRGFVWGYRQTENDELSGINFKGEDQTMTQLANNEYTTADMKDGLLATQEYFKGEKGHNRWVIRFTFDPTRTCCIYATTTQSVISTITKTAGEMKESFLTAYKNIVKAFKEKILGSSGGGGYEATENNWCKEHDKARSECSCRNQES